MRNEIASNHLLNSYERNNLLSTWDAVIANYSGLLEVSYSLYNGQIYTIARTQGWFRTAWRVIRSVVLTAAVGLIVGFYTCGPPCAIVGAVVMGVVAIADAWANNYCHFAMQCDGGWRQDCSSGVCMAY